MKDATGAQESKRDRKERKAERLRPLNQSDPRSRDREDVLHQFVTFFHKINFFEALNDNLEPSLILHDRKTKHISIKHGQNHQNAADSQGKERRDKNPQREQEGRRVEIALSEKREEDQEGTG